MSTAATPFKIDRIGNVTDRATGAFLGCVVENEWDGVFNAVFYTTPLPADDDGTVAWNRHLAEHGRPAHLEWFKVRKQAAQFLWDTREFARATFPPPPFKGPEKKDNGWICGDDVSGVWYHVHSDSRPTFCKIQDDNGERWGVYGHAHDLVPGTKVAVRRSNGVPSEITVGEVSETTVLFGIPMVTAEIVRKGKPRKPKETEFLPGYLRQYGSRSECPGCGEDISGMWNGRRCDECGYRK
ncbi:MAG: hypothetical protein WAV90_04520 [Gordonia amarae]